MLIVVGVVSLGGVVFGDLTFPLARAFLVGLVIPLPRVVGPDVGFSVCGLRSGVLVSCGVAQWFWFLMFWMGLVC